MKDIQINEEQYRRLFKGQCFDEYPYLVIKLEGTSMQFSLLPSDLALDELQQTALKQELANRFPVCLVISETECYYIQDGAPKFHGCPPIPTAVIINRMKLCEEFDIPQNRTAKLEAYQQRFQKYPYLNEKQKRDLVNIYSEAGESNIYTEIAERKLKNKKTLAANSSSEILFFSLDRNPAFQPGHPCYEAMKRRAYKQHAENRAEKERLAFQNALTPEPSADDTPTQ